MKNILSAVIVAAGLVVGGSCIANGIIEFASQNRFVTVKGLSEREVQADKVIWPIRFNTAGNNLASLKAENLQTNKILLQFFKENGVNDSEVTVSPISVTDLKAQNYVSERIQFRYIIENSVVITSNDVAKIAKLMEKQSDLLEKGIVIATNEWQVQYLYTGLNQIKPVMVEEATKNARTVAEKFAKDANCNLGSIQHANQGQFSINDTPTPTVKKIRVVTTVNYYLK